MGQLSFKEWKVTIPSEIFAVADTDHHRLHRFTRGYMQWAGETFVGFAFGSSVLAMQPRYGHGVSGEAMVIMM